MIDKKNITGIILAGGQSSRMGHDKGFLKLKGTTFMSHIVEAIKPLVGDIIIVSNNPDYDVFNLKRINDIIKDAGPLSGLYSGLYHSKTENNLVLSCDVPLINTTILKKLISEIASDVDVVQIQSLNKTMPLIATYKKQCMHECLTLLQKGERRLQFAVTQLKTKTIELDPDLDKYVRNINTRDQLNDIQNEVEY